MPAQATAGIRNIALAGASGAGKTALLDALLHAAGTLSAGQSARGLWLDTEPAAKSSGHTLEPAMVSCEHDGLRLNLVDTPGYPDLIGRTLAVLPAVDTLALVVNAASGPDSVARRLMDAARARGLCRLIIVNHMDGAPERLQAMATALRETFGAGCLPLNLPAGSGTRVVDCYFIAPDTAQGEDADFGSVAPAHEQIVDQVVELDEELMSLYLEQGENLQPAQLHDAFERALREGHLIPVCFTSATTGAGIPELLRVIEHLAPSPLEANAPRFLDGTRAEPIALVPDPGGPVLAQVVKVIVDPFVGRLSVFRVQQGTLRRDAQLYVNDARKPFKVAHLYRMRGREQIETDAAVAGDICAVAKVDDIRYGDVLHDAQAAAHIRAEPPPLPAPMVGLALRTAKRGDEQKLADGLAVVAAEDPSLRVEHNAALNETVLRGLGELHLRTAIERITERYKLELETHPPRIEYRETITAPAEGHHRHKKQTGGAGQFGEVFLRVAPLPRGAGFEFEDAVVGGTIPRQFMPAVHKGVRQALDAGAVAGYPVQDVKVTVYEGKHHPVDSKEVAFVTAARKAFLDAVGKARPVVLEPIVRIEITAPAACVGDLAGDLSSRRGRVSGTATPSADIAVVTGEVPAAELADYAARLKALTGGSGSYTVEFAHYEPVPARVQQELAAAWRPAAEEA
jgi:elongation factor G